MCKSITVEGRQMNKKQFSIILGTSLRILSYNCQSFRNNEQTIKSFLTSCGILCLQETSIDDAHQHVFLHYLYFPSGVQAQSVRLEFSAVVFTNRFKGLKVSAKRTVYLMLNVYSFREFGKLDSVLN